MVFYHHHHAKIFLFEFWSNLGASCWLYLFMTYSSIFISKNYLWKNFCVQMNFGHHHLAKIFLVEFEPNMGALCWRHWFMTYSCIFIDKNAFEKKFLFTWFFVKYWCFTRCVYWWLIQAFSAKKGLWKNFYSHCFWSSSWCKNLGSLCWLHLVMTYSGIFI